jgi:hypothetical protein
MACLKGRKPAGSECPKSAPEGSRQTRNTSRAQVSWGKRRTSGAECRSGDNNGDNGENSENRGATAATEGADNSVCSGRSEATNTPEPRRPSA